jgi:hypothetical protein
VACETARSAPLPHALNPQTPYLGSTLIAKGMKLTYKRDYIHVTVVIRGQC